MDVLSVAAVVAIGESRYEADARAVRREGDSTDEELVRRRSHHRVAGRIVRRELHRLIPRFGAGDRRHCVVTRMEAGIPVLSVVVGEREADPRLGGVGFCVLLAFALIPTLPGRAQKIEQLRYGTLARRGCADNRIVGEIDCPVIVVCHHNVRWIHAGDPDNGLVLPLAEEISDVLVRAAGDDVDVLTDGRALRFDDREHRHGRSGHKKYDRRSKSPSHNASVDTNRHRWWCRINRYASGSRLRTRATVVKRVATYYGPLRLVVFLWGSADYGECPSVLQAFLSTLATRAARALIEPSNE